MNPLEEIANRLVVPGLRAAAALCGVQVYASHELHEMRLSGVRVVGEGFAELRDEFGLLKELVVFQNLITDNGDLYYAKRGANISTVPAIIGGMKLGTGTGSTAKATTPSTGPWARIQTYVTGSAAAIAGSYPQGSQTPSAGYKVTWKSSWAAGTATATGIAEASTNNEGSTGNTPGTPTNASDTVDTATISRALLSPVVNKGSLDTLDITWEHILLGA